MTDATYTPPPNDEIWDLRQQVLFLQEVALRLFDTQNWWGAYKTVSRIELLTRNLPDRNNNPFVHAAAEFLGQDGIAHLAPASATDPASATAPPGAAQPRGPTTPEEAHAHFMRILGDTNEKRARARQPLIGVGKMLKWYAKHYGRAAADAIRAVEARAKPVPTG